MYYGLLALLTRSLRQDARQLRNHVFRLVFVAFIYLFLLIATLTSSMFGAPGLRFFNMIAWLNAIFISCAGIGFFASAITEEKEEETLGLLTMAGLNPLAILMGKSTSRLIQALLLLVVQFPFMLLAVTLGGVTPYQIFACYVALAAFLILLANVALIWSTICERTGSAAGMTCMMLVGYGITPFVAPVISAQLSRNGWSQTSTLGACVFGVLQFLANTTVFLQITKIMTTGFKDPVISQQVIADTVGGGICFLIAWAVFIPFTRHSASGSVSRGLVLRKSTRVRFLGAGRPWAMPLVWKDFQFITGGFSLIIVKLFGYTLMALTLVYAESIGALSIWVSNSIEETFVIVMGAVIVIESSVIAARIFHDEVRLQTLSSLLMLPRSIPYIGYTKALGCLLGLLPSVLGLIVGSLMLRDVPADRVLHALIDPAVWGGVLMLMIFLHLIALLSLFVKWSAVPLAIVIMVPFTFCCPVGTLLALVVAPNGGIRDTAGAFAATITVWILIGLFCFVFQMMIASRLQEIGSK